MNYEKEMEKAREFYSKAMTTRSKVCEAIVQEQQALEDRLNYLKNFSLVM